MLSNLSVHDVRVENYVLTAVAVVVTCLRLGDRVRTGRFWWDDAWAAFAMVLLITFMAAVEVHLQDPAKHSEHLKLVIAYMLPHLFYAVTWSARLSILLTVIRISLGTMRKVLVWTGILFLITYLVLFAQIWWVCEDNAVWKTSFNPQCPLGLNVAIAQVITDVVSDAILILAPVRLVWKTKLSAAQKVRVMAIFSTTLITTAVSLNHAYFVLKWGGLQEALAAILQCNVCLIVANLSVIIAFFFRINTEDEATVDTFTMGATTRSFFSWRKRAPMPVTSTFIKTDGGVRERKDVYQTGTFAVDTVISNTHKPYDDDVPKSSSEQSVSDKV
ncbi:hypothetical protein GALMADRAFT_211910 [Galerina marginata CBS 339.88]|uniref:Rhodopsin domain-containing protein n=1 Tax=Galerina marginata (strain CBS 339.88) TaxID=685588 RepID=A0A067STT4_GALM3|nr:hypothetical protein GALMADRAFT_211910 [Galerina marginata CBS 339.88]